MGVTAVEMWVVGVTGKHRGEEELETDDSLLRSLTDVAKRRKSSSIFHLV